MKFRTIRDTDYRGKRVLVREDLNVPMDGDAITDETRITAALPTLRVLREAGAKIVVCSHLGRPEGRVVEKLSLRPIASRLGERLGISVKFAADCIGDERRTMIEGLADGEVLLLENVRFHPEEKRNDPTFARALAEGMDAYVNDAFGSAHRAHASTEGVAHLIPSAAGILMQNELESLTVIMDNAKHPYVCAIGGSKVHDKVAVFEALIERVDAFVIGGGMANTFLAAGGVDIGKSLRDEDLAPARHVIATAKERDVRLHLPVDAVVAESFDADETAATVLLEQPLGERMILDIGPTTAGVYASVLRKAKTIVFNGPMGVYERAPYREGTRVVGRAIAEATHAGAISVVGGGDAAAAAKMLGFADDMSHVSTGGGATLEFLEGKSLPGVAALEASANVA